MVMYAVATFPAAWGWAIFVVTGIFMFLVSWIVYKKFQLDSDSFFVASRGVPWPLIASTIAATELWTGTILASAEGVFRWGIGGIWMYAIPTGVSFSIFSIIAHRTRYLTPNGLTLGSWVKKRYGKSTHIIFCLVALYIMFVFTMFQVIGGASLFSSLFGMSYTSAAIVIGAVFVGYYLLAGMWTTLITSFIQYFIIVLIVLILVPWAWMSLGGTGAIFSMLTAEVERLREPNLLNLFRVDGIVQYFLMTLGGWGVIATMSNYAWQRAYSVEEKGVTKAMLFGGWCWFPIAAVSGTIGMLGIAMGMTGHLAVGTDVFPAVIGQLLPPGAALYLAVALLFAVYSSGTAYLGGFTSLLASDFYEQYTGKKMSINAIRLLSVAMGLFVIIIVVALQRVSLLNFMLSTGVFIPAPFFAIVFGLYWKKTTCSAANVATVSTLGIALWIMFLSDLPNWLAYVVSYALSLTLCVIISLFKPNNYDFEKLRAENLKDMQDRAAKLQVS